MFPTCGLDLIFIYLLCQMVMVKLMHVVRRIKPELTYRINYSLYEMMEKDYHDIWFQLCYFLQHLEARRVPFQYLSWIPNHKLLLLPNHKLLLLPNHKLLLTSSFQNFSFQFFVMLLKTRTFNLRYKQVRPLAISNIAIVVKDQILAKNWSIS